MAEEPVPPNPATVRALSVGNFAESLRLLFSRRFGTFFFATLMSNLGTWAQLIAEPWLLLNLGASAFLIGLDNFALTAPAFVLTLIGGVLADRGDRRRVITVFQSIQMMCPTILVVLLLTGTVSPWMVIGLSAVVGITDALSMPAFQSIVPLLVPREQIGKGVALNSIQFNLSRVLGPAIAGALMATAGAVACFALSAASYIPFIGVALWAIPKRAAVPNEGPALNRKTLFIGAQTVARDPALRRPLVTVLITSMFCAPLTGFVPVLVREAFNGDVTNFSTAVTVFGAGGVAGAVLLLGAHARLHAKLMAPLAAVYGVAVVACGANPWFGLLPALLFVAGFAMTTSNISANAQIQTIAAPGIGGQAVSLYMLSIRGGMAIGALTTGTVAHLLGIRVALIANGVMAITLQVALMLIARRRARA